MEYSKKENITDVEINIVKKYLLAHDTIDKIGRKFADISFNFARCGVRDNELYDLLLQITTKELLRYGNRKSCRLVDVVSTVEKLAISGFKYEQFDALKELFTQKSFSFPDEKMSTIEDVKDSKLSMFSSYPLLSLYSYLSRQDKKIRADGINFDGATITNLLQFNNSHPIVLELGSGFGINLLSMHKEYKNFNYIGIDLNSRSVAYSNSIASRWNVTHQVKFILGDVKACLQQLVHYTKQAENKPLIDTIIINFPTPFSIAMYDNDVIDCHIGNSQLPKNEEEFMVSPNTLEMIQKLFYYQKEKSPMHRNNLYVQSNIEDIIVYIKNEIDTLGGFCYPRSSADTGILKSSNISSDSENIFASEDSQVNKRRSMVEQKLGRKNKAFGYDQVTLVQRIRSANCWRMSLDNYQ